MKIDDFKRISGYGALAMRLLRESKIPPTPQFYELLFIYAAGTNPELNTRINAVLKAGEKPDRDLVEALHREFMQDNDVDLKLGQVSSEIAASIESVYGALDHAHASANSYSGLLQSASGDLAEGLDSKDLALLTASLLKETRKMQATNAELEGRLASARSHISDLQDDLEKVRLESMLDPLTKIRNRQAFDKAMDECLGRAENGAMMTLILVDIDHFKAFNDNFGHQTGDQVLRLVASTLDTHTKDSDIAARYGGEEFGVILPETDISAAVDIAERLRLAVRSRELLKRSTRENLGKISASFGVATYRMGDTVASIIERADACLYAAKRNGRNQVIAEHQLAEMMKRQGNAA